MYLFVLRRLILIYFCLMFQPLVVLVFGVDFKKLPAATAWKAKDYFPSVSLNGRHKNAEMFGKYVLSVIKGMEHIERLKTLKFTLQRIVSVFRKGKNKFSIFVGSFKRKLFSRFSAVM